MPIDWIPIQLPLTLQLPGEGLHMPVTEFEVTRPKGLDLLLSGTVHGAPVRHERVAPTPGTLARAVEIPCRTARGGLARLTWHGPRGWSETGTQLDTLKTTANGKAERISIALNEAAADHITEWLTNVPSERIWPRTSIRETMTVSLRRRGEDQVEDTAKSSSSASDHVEFCLDLPTLSRVRFGVAHPIDKKEVEGIAKPGFLEFWAGKAGLPDDHLRNSVRRALEFLFGCGFGVLGWSEESRDGVAIRATLLSPHVAGGFGPPLPPGLLHPNWADGIDEQILTSFVASYLAREHSFDLNRLVWLYLHARNAPLDMTCGYVGAAFEIVRRGYYALPENEARSRRLPPDKWRELAKLLAAQIDSLSRLPAWAPLEPDLEALTARLGDLNAISGTKLNTQFLDDLRLNHDEVEKKALLARNDAAHANPLGPEDFGDTLASYRALHTLLARAVFAILGIDTQYFDYSALGFPNRILSQRQGTTRS